MAKLSKQWFFEPVFDFEYKTYELQAYLRDLKTHFSQSMFYPYLTDLHGHMDDVRRYKEGIEKLESSLRRDLKEIDLRKMRFVRQPLPDDAGVIDELGQIVDYAQQHLSYTYQKGVADLNKTSEEVHISPLGLIARSNSSGFLFFRKPRQTRIYSYKLRMVRRAVADQAYMDVQTSYLEEIRTGMLTNFNEVKWRLIKNSGSESSLNAYLIETNTEIPQYETLLPLAKQYLIKTSASGPMEH
jgi:hypothetical protein